VVFGLSMKNQNKLSVDLNIKELLIIILCVTLSFLFTGLFNFFV
jgi:hypothetical protein